MAFIAILAVCIAVLCIVRWVQGRSPTTIPAYKGEGSLSFLSDAEAYAMRPIELILKATAQCGNVFSVQVLTIYNVWLRGNTLNKFYLDQREDVWSFVGGMGLFLNKLIQPGYWDHYKTLLSSLNRYINTNVAQDYAAVVSTEEALKAATQWETAKDFELFDTISFMVHRTIVRALMGDDFYEHNADELLDLVHAMEEDIGSLFSFVLPDWVPHPPARRIRNARERVKEIFLERLAERDVVDRKDSRPLQDYVAFTMEDKATVPLRHFMPSHHTMLMFAAHTSTAAMIAWNIICLLRHPGTMKKVTDELRSSPDAMDSLLLQACLKETLRCYSGFKTLRLARKEVKIPDTDAVVPVGALVSISPYLTHFDADNFPDPSRWAPERWMTNSGDLVQIDNKSGGVKFLPFSGGCHRCPGEKLAMIMVTRSLVALLREYDFEWATPQTPDTTDFTALDFDKVGAPWLKGGVRVRVKKA